MAQQAQTQEQKLRHLVLTQLFQQLLLPAADMALFAVALMQVETGVLVAVAVEVARVVQGIPHQRHRRKALMVAVLLGLGPTTEVVAVVERAARV